MLPSVFKHDLIKRYLPVFAGKTGSRAGGVVYLDGYAGRGRYEDGKPASAELILQIAENHAKQNVQYRIFFYEPDSGSYSVLKGVVGEYAARGVTATAERSQVLRGLDTVIAAADGLPLFLFLDPCGLGMPFSVLTQALSGSRRAKWPPTEILLNFSLEAVRRIGGHVASPTPNENTMRRLDDALGGSWWREHVRRGVTDDAVSAVVDGFKDRLSRAAGMDVFTVPVLRGPGQKPVYHLVFGTRRPLGTWHLADCTARATQTWWTGLTALKDAKMLAIGQGSLFEDEPIIMGPRLEDVEAQAVPVIADNILRLVGQRGPCRVGDYPAEVFGVYLGRVREVVVRSAIKKLHSEGQVSGDGKGSPIASLIVRPPS
jgi:three-Cys-motif partner protein